MPLSPHLIGITFWGKLCKTAGCHHAKNMMILNSVFFLRNSCTFTQARSKIFCLPKGGSNRPSDVTFYVTHMVIESPVLWLWAMFCSLPGRQQQTLLLSSFRQVISGANTLHSKSPCHSLLFAILKQLYKCKSLIIQKLCHRKIILFS